MEKGRAMPRSYNWIVGGSLLCIVGMLAAMYMTLARTPAAGTFHDDGIYLVTAKSLAEDHGYRIISIPGEPPQTKYPILFPWLVSLVWRLVSLRFPQTYRGCELCHWSRVWHGSPSHGCYCASLAPPSRRLQLSCSSRPCHPGSHFFQRRS